MNFDYDDSQHALKEEARRFLAARCPITVVRRVLDDPNPACDVALWKSVVEQGWPGAAIPEASGGLGMGYVTLCALAEELGRAVAPIPFASSIYRFSEALLLAQDSTLCAEILPGIVSGEWVGTVALADGVGDPLVTAEQVRIEDGRLHGVRQPVIDGSIADWAVVLAGDQLWLVDLNGEGVAREALGSLDPTRGLARLTFTGAPVRSMARAGTGLAQAIALDDRAAVLLAFEQLGGAQRCLEMACDYVLKRFAFGRPIGSYQAVKHRLADMAVKIEVARANAYFAAWALENDAPEFARAACAARIAGSEAYWFASREGLHLHGGIGFTWEMDCHIHYRRAQFLNLMLGPPARWKRRLADLIAGPAAEASHGL